MPGFVMPQTVQSLPRCVRFLEAGGQPVTPGFWKDSGADAFWDGALFNQAHLMGQSQRDLELQVW